MSTSVWAHITNGVCDNIAVFDDNTPMQYFPGYVDIQGLDPMPGIGWHYENGEWYAPPRPTLVADPWQVPNDGTTEATVTYTWQGWPEDAAPTEADFTINGGAPQTVAMSGDTASINVTSADADVDGNITVQCAGLVATVTVTAA